MTNTPMLKQKIAESGYRYGYLADQLGISRQSFSMKVNDVRDFKLHEVKTLCKILAITKYSDKETIFFND